MSLFRSLLAAFFSQWFYRAVAHEWRLRRAIALLTAALAIGWLVQMGTLRRSGMVWLEEEGARAIERLPTLRLRATVLDADPPGPHEFIGADGEYLVIDTSGATTSLERNGTLITANQVIIRRPVDTRVVELATLVDYFDLEDGPIEKKDILDRMTAAVRWFPVIAYPFAVLAAVAYRLVHAVGLALLGTVLGRLVGARLSFSRLFVVAVACLVPLVLIEHAASTAGVAVSGWGAVFLAIAYLLFSLRAIATSETRDPPRP